MKTELPKKNFQKIKPNLDLLAKKLRLSNSKLMAERVKLHDLPF